MLILVAIFCAGVAWANHSSSGPAFPPTTAGCTTLQPIFTFPQNGTSTVFASSETTTSTVDCRGCSLVTSTFGYVIPGVGSTPTTTTTISSTPTTLRTYVCSPPAKPGNTISSVALSITQNTPAPIPPVAPEAQELINELKTVLLYVSLIANDGFSDELCSVINPPALSNGTGYNGTAVLSELCFTGAIQNINPALYQFVVIGNQLAVNYVEATLFAVQTAAGYLGVKPSKAELQGLCDQIDEETINTLFNGYLTGGGTRAKNFVCGAASV